MTSSESTVWLARTRTRAAATAAMLRHPRATGH
jgi:hypothetical protein